MRKPCQFSFLFRTHLSKIPAELCFDANLSKNFILQNSVVSCASTPTLHAPHSRACVQAIQAIVAVMKVVPIVGINDFHPARQKFIEEEVRKEVPDAMCFGSTGKNALFWRRPQWRGRPGGQAGRQAGVAGQAAGQAGRQASRQASRRAGSLILIQNLRIQLLGLLQTCFLRLRIVISKNSRFFDEECF